MKKIIVVTGLILTLTLSTIFADDLKTIFTLDSLQNEISEDHTKIELKELSLNVEEEKLVDAKTDANKNNYSGGSAVGYINRQIIVKSNPLLAELNVELAKRAIVDQETDLKNDVNLFGMDLILLNLEKAYNEEIKTYKEAKIGFREARVNAGLETAANLNDLILDLDSHVLSMSDIDTKVENKVMDINYLLERPLTSEIELKDYIEAVAFETYDVEKILVENIANDDTYYTKKITYDAKVINYNIYKKEYDEFKLQEAKDLDPKRPEDEIKEEERILDYKKEITDGLVKAEYDMKIAELELRDAERTYEINLRTAYNNYTQANDSYKIRMMEKELSETKLKDAQIKYDLGTINKEDLMSAEESVISKNFNMNKAIYDFNKAKMDLENLF
jgi:hypothetical protein